MHTHSKLADFTDTKQIIAPAAHTSGQTGYVDMAGWEGVEFELNYGAFTGAGALDAYIDESANSNFSGATNISGAVITQVAAANANGVITMDIYRPTSRYVRLHMVPSVNTVVISATAKLYRKSGLNPTSHSGVAQTVAVVEN